MAKENGRKGRISRGGVRTDRGRPGAGGHTEGARKKDHPEECGDGSTIHTTTLTGETRPRRFDLFIISGMKTAPGAIRTRRR
jgi:hypothetical protein